MNEKEVAKIVEQVLNEMQSTSAPSQKKLKGVFNTMEEAIDAVKKAYKQFRGYSVEQREAMISKIREKILAEAEVMAKMGVSETKMGRVADKTIKHLLVAQKTPGTEDLNPRAYSGDNGLTLVEPAPFGIIGAITPSTNPSETVLCNSMGMLAGGNCVIFNPHPNAKETSLYAVDLVNRAVQEAGGPENVVVSTSLQWTHQI